MFSIPATPPPFVDAYEAEVCCNSFSFNPLDDMAMVKFVMNPSLTVAADAQSSAPTDFVRANHISKVEINIASST
jgi:hypothetical protein